MRLRGILRRPSDWIPLRRSLFTKYFLSFVGLVSLVLLVNGAVGSWLAYRQAREAAVLLQAEKAEAAAQRTGQFVAEIERQIGWTTHAQWAIRSIEQRQFDYARLLRQVPAITELVEIDAAGREQLKVSRLAMDVIGGGTDYSAEPRFREALANRIWFSPVYFRKESEPYLTIAVAHGGRNAGVTVAEVNLKLIWDVISTIKVGQEGYAYVVDRQGRLIAHPDISLVLRNTNLSHLPQVAAALASPNPSPGLKTSETEAVDPMGHGMLSASAPIQRLGWLVFVDLPLGEALAPLYATLSQTVSLLLGGLGLSALAGLLLTRRMVGPIRRLQEGAVRLGRGDLSYRLDVRTGDELERLAEGFNSMAEQIEESQRLLEAKVEERTQALTEALTYQTATGDVLKAISRSTLHLQPVLDTLVATASQLCRADKGFLFQLEDGLYRLKASFGFDQEFKRYIEASPIRPDASGTVVGRTAMERGVLHYDDVTTDERYTWTEAYRWGGFRTALGVPLLRDGEPIGVFVLARNHVEPFTGKQIELVTVFADQAVIAIENARLVRELKEQSTALATSVEELKALAETGQAVSGTLDLARVLELVSARAMALGQADACAVFRYDRGNRQFTLWQASGLEEVLSEQIRSLRILEAETAMGAAIRQRAPVSIADLTEMPRWPLRDAAVEAGMRSVLIVPLVRAERVFGALVLMRREEAEFPTRTVDLMQTFATQSVLAIQNARLFREIEEKGRQLEIASQHKSQFLANMSHELRTPLNAVLGYTEMLLDGIYGEVAGEAHEILEYIQSNGEHLLALINDVLDLSKIEAGQLTLMLDDYAVQSVIEAVIAVAQPLARAKGLDLQVSVGKDLPLGRGDERRLTQVLLNLVGNAIKFTDTGSVRITAGTSGSLFELTVTDTGPGIAAADQERIFDPFQQVDNSSTREKGGTGLGLAISKRIIRMHGGTITVDSAPGRGATFRITVPIQVDEIMEAA
jgi:signal transduction histidine kinase